jgi:hypothetical protein
MRGITATGLVFGFDARGFAVIGFAAFDFVALRALTRGLVVRRDGFWTDFLDFAARRDRTAFLPAALDLPRFLLAAFDFAGRGFRCIGLDRWFFPDFLAMLPPVRSN